MTFLSMSVVLAMLRWWSLGHKGNKVRHVMVLNAGAGDQQTRPLLLPLLPGRQRQATTDINYMSILRTTWHSCVPQTCKIDRGGE